MPHRIQASKNIVERVQNVYFKSELLTTLYECSPEQRGRLSYFEQQLVVPQRVIRKAYFYDPWVVKLALLRRSYTFHMLAFLSCLFHVICELWAD